MVCGVSLLTTGREMFTVTFTRIYKLLAALVLVKNEVFKWRRGISYLSVTVESLSLSLTHCSRSISGTDFVTRFKLQREGRGIRCIADDNSYVKYG